MNQSLKIDNNLLDNLAEQAQQSPRLRINYDLRNSPEESSQRMLNSLEPGTVLPIHRHRSSNEVVVLIRGRVRQNLYDHQGNIIESFEASANGPVFGFSVPQGVWHNIECLESHTVLIECKDGKYQPLSPQDIIEKKQ